MDEKTGRITYDIPPVYKIPGRNRKDQGRLRWIIKKNNNINEIFDSISKTYEVGITHQDDLISKKDEIIEAIFRKYEEEFKLEKDEDNEIKNTIGFSIFEFGKGVDKYVGFIISIDGQQFMPGTYTNSDGNTVYNPTAFINTIFLPFFSGNNWAFSHSERKILITLYYLFGLNIKELSMTMITNRKFCHSCYRQIIDFIDIYQRYGAISESFQAADYMNDLFTILDIPKTY